MQLNLGMKIRELRRRDRRTQEALAEALGVTSQAVSRWESGGSYPDMEVIPSIANYFGITIDELFGYDNDREERIKSIIDKANKEIFLLGNDLSKGNGDITECVEMLRATALEFPNEPQILLKLGDALYILGWQKNGAKVCTQGGSDYIYDDVDYNLHNIYWKEALQVYEKLLKIDTSGNYREKAVFTMIMLYKKIGAYEKAKILANEQNSIVLCKEVLLPKSVMGEEMDKYQGESIIALLQELYIAVSNSVASKISVYTNEYGRNVLLSLANLFETIFADRRCGSQHMSIRYLYLALTNYEAQYGGDIQRAVEYFDKGFEHHKEYCRICSMKEYSYSAPLVSNEQLSEKNFRLFLKISGKTGGKACPKVFVRN